ncbi:AAA ATPase [Onygenales sp. PD_12]|nr:AAA ATPase [Onygenales sp. PD_12]
MSSLGKRQRQHVEADGISSKLRSSKRRATALQIHEENVPSILPATSRRSKQPGSTTLPVRNARSKRTVSDKTSSAHSSNTTISQASDTAADENSHPQQFSTPKTSRYRNALPATPRHRVQISGKPLTPRTPRTPRTIASPAVAQSVYAPARQLFARSATPTRLVGRGTERDELCAFLQDAIQSRHGGCMYVSGPPGTGKSAMVDEVCHDMDVAKSVKVAHINCASMTSSKDIYSKLTDELCDDPQLFKKSRSDLLQTMFLQKKRTAPFYLVTLDEIDHLLTSDVEILYTLFEWSLQQDSHLILIGIANALDLTDRFLPRLKTKNLRPRLLPFLPYTPSQISSIITTRLRSLLPDNHSGAQDYVPFLHPAAIQLCSRKIASQTGDLRKAFDIVRRTIDLIEQETQQKANTTSKMPLVENANLASPLSPPDTPSTKSSAPIYTASTAPRATVAHVARATSSAFGNGTTQRLQGLNLQQKAALCSLIALGRKQKDADSLATPSKSSRATAPTVHQLFSTYCTLCRKDKILQPLTSTEFRDVLGSLETLGLIGESQGRGRGASTPSKSARSASSTPSRLGADDRGLACFVGEKEIETHISGAGEGILRALLRAEF